MPFQKGNKLATVNKGQIKPKTQAWDNIVGWLVGEGGDAYRESLAKLSTDKEISKPRKEFLEHYETLLEFHQPKLARQQIDSTVKIDSLVTEQQAKKILESLNTNM